MSIHVHHDRRLVIVHRKAFEVGLTPSEFRVYCQLIYLGDNQEFDNEQLAADCCITNQEFNLACQRLESLGFISRYDGVIEIHEIEMPRYQPPVRVVQESFARDTERYQVLPLRLSCVYVVKSELNGLTKIGMTKTPRNRIKSIVTKHRFDVEILQLIKCHAPKILENLLHLEFSQKQIEFAGEREWFQLSDADLQQIPVVTARFSSLVASEV